MKTVFIAYTGSEDLITIPEIEPAAGEEQTSTFRIHGVFSSLEEYKQFELGYGMVREFSSMNYMEIPFNPPNGMITKSMQLFHVVLTDQMEIQSVEITDRKPFADLPLTDPLNADRSIETRYRKDGTADIYCYARDREDACRMAYEEYRIGTIGNIPVDFEEEEFENDVVAKLIIHMPTSSPVSFELPAMFKIPEVGEMFEIKFEDFITDPEEWELALSTLENDVMVVDRIEENEIWLREGNLT